MRLRAWVCSGGVGMTALFGSLLAACGGGAGMDGEYSEPSESASVSEALPTDDGAAESESGAGSPSEPLTHSASSTCASKLVTWSKVYTTGWTGNTATKGTYYCSATLSTTANGVVVTVSPNSPTRKGSAQYKCNNGVWSAPVSTPNCDGAIISTATASGYSTICSSSDAVRQKWIGWYLADLKRCADTEGLNWWVNQYNANADCLPYDNYKGHGSKDACWRAQFRDGANQNGNSYNEAQGTGHISAWDEASLCSGPYGTLAYPWSSVTTYGTSCKYLP